ncbi:MAG: bifunctional ADP-dependent NAD(P)H-hydrate dehydratase/NAD(P)H-hydrate epimerase [Solirubrobacteraceae bacterium]
MSEIHAVLDPPAWLEPLLDAEQMRATDRWAIEQRAIPSLELMERAGGALTRVTQELAPHGPVAVLCGKGNNGGDGLVAARLLREAGRTVEVVLAAGPADRGDARINLERLPGPAPHDGPAPRTAPVLVIDALLGTGFSGAPRGGIAAAIRAVAGLPVLACDVPSGVDASSGRTRGEAVRARLTATFHAAKPGLWIAPGKQHAGEVRVLDIGIPAGGPGRPACGLMRRSALLDSIPRRQVGTTKFKSGHVLVVGGSPGLTGAASLAAEAAMRAGAGYVTACVPSALSLVFETRLLEVMTLALEGHDERGVEQVLAAARSGSAIVLGPGLGGAAADFARQLTQRAELPLLLDADGLNAHAGELESLRARRAGTVLTPHEGELGRLLGVPASYITAARLGHVREAAARSGAIVVLKGDDTLVARADGAVAVSPGATPALATAGTGDVLAGVCGALLAKGMEPWAAACAAVTLHARAAARGAELHGPDGMIASDVIEALSRSLA